LSKTAQFDPINYQKKIMRTSLLLSISLFTSLLASTASAQIASPNQFGEARGSYVPKVDVTDRRQMINLYNTFNVRWKDMFTFNEKFPTGRTADPIKCMSRLRAKPTCIAPSLA
jgi:hypothetical protein